jgi:hypothetical protein
MNSGIPNQKKKQSFADKTFLRGNLFIPDARFFVTPSVAFLEKYILENNIDTVVTSVHHIVSYRIRIKT